MLLSEVLRFLNANAGALTFVFIAVVAVATVMYARLTARLVAETHSLREAQTDPSISVSLDIRPEAFHLIYLLIRNDGPAVARDVTFDVSYDPDHQPDADIKEALDTLGFVRNGIRHLAPGQEIRTFFVHMYKGDASRLDTAFDVTVRYSTPSGSTKSEYYRIDLSYLRGIAQVGTTPLVEIAKYLKSIEADLHRLALGQGFISADRRVERSSDGSKGNES